MNVLILIPSLGTAGSNAAAGGGWRCIARSEVEDFAVGAAVAELGAADEEAGS